MEGSGEPQGGAPVDREGSGEPQVGAPVKPVLLLASANQGKLRELRTILAGLPVELVGLTEAGLGDPPEVEETGDTFLENARIKARAYAAWSGRAAVADDSGLEVDALGGAPGVRSARYAGEGAGDRANLDKLLAALAGVPPERRTARFRCAAVLVDPKAVAPRRKGSGTPRRHGKDGCWTPPGGPAGSATTRCSCPTAGTGPVPRSTR
jgi:non-canonical purine NTP pyrophosphatase (RdgB/HAM1 family)